eukprot:CAMPEP_0203807586 /NCGR_PEP_ID=MMETSP0115-20131106/1152_1 /ASSEMBLY_ACC=CAM_ASM_000227 /TAXON_ID=33651 /ORGANISM="Bicosoecid sp, Strain ms1" /LENGTH=358 /DNA_ID=CAMNT_0050716269 /DNA_START=39 /DNA_END=1115 /DNA_ORIENTATION=-
MAEARTDVPDNAAAECVGTQSAEAGKAAGCEGCPNQSLCASGATKAADPALAAAREALAGVKHKILVLSGKGGVGKSTFSAQLAFSLAARDFQVGILDIDLCGPSIPRMLGVEGRAVHESGSGWEPVWLNENVAVMSIGFMMPDKDGAVLWRGPKKSGLIKQFLTDVDWGELDYLIVDTPPGTSDEHITVAQTMKEAGIDGAVVVSTPQEVAMADVRKELSYCRKLGINVMGIVENMAGFVCPCCKTQADIFPRPKDGGPAAMAAAYGLPFLGSLPLDPRMASACEAGEAFTTMYPDSPAAGPFNAVVDKIVAATDSDEDSETAEDEAEGGGAVVAPAGVVVSAGGAGGAAPAVASTE